MLKVEINNSGQIFISGDSSDLNKLKYHISEVVDHQMSMTKSYDDFKWNAWETKEPSKTVTVRIG